MYGILQNITCGGPHLHKLRCAVASCDVRAELILVVTCDMGACMRHAVLGAEAFWVAELRVRQVMLWYFE